MFKVYPLVEHKSGDPEWVLWRVRHDDGKDYLMAYRGTRLVEVYFVGEGSDHHFMSCRTDGRTVSHYRVDRRYNVVRRYENGVRNRLYHDDRNGRMWYEGPNGVVEYRQTGTGDTPDPERLRRDLSEFLRRPEIGALDRSCPPYCK